MSDVKMGGRAEKDMAREQQGTFGKNKENK